MILTKIFFFVFKNICLRNCIVEQNTYHNFFFYKQSIGFYYQMLRVQQLCRFFCSIIGTAYTAV